MKTLVVVDVQRDFFDPSGSLYVPGGEQLPAKIVALAGGYDRVIFTMDWHPSDHCSFKEQGGPWPPHCVAYTQGAGLADAFASLFPKAILHFKGTDSEREQYGAFEFNGTSGEIDIVLGLLRDSEEVAVCGIAGDFCVKETTANLLRLIPAQKIVMLTDCICSIDDGSTLKDFIQENKLSTR